MELTSFQTKILKSLGGLSEVNNIVADLDLKYPTSVTLILKKPIEFKGGSYKDIDISYTGTGHYTIYVTTKNRLIKVSEVYLEDLCKEMFKLTGLNFNSEEAKILASVKLRINN